MRFRTKLLITSLAIVIIPIILAMATYFAVGRYLIYDQQIDQYSKVVDYGMISDPGGTFSEMTEQLVKEINEVKQLAREKSVNEKL